METSRKPDPDQEEARRRAAGEDVQTPPIAQVREEDLEPHAGLRYIARLFKALAILLAFLLVAEVIVGLRQAGAASLMAILVEGTRIVVFAGFLWAAGDLAVMFIESNHDLRAVRILLGRLNSRLKRLADDAERGQGPPSPPVGPLT